MEKLNIQSTKLLLQLEVNFIDGMDGHLCSGCTRNLTDKECEIFDNLNSLEASLSEDNVMSLVYVSGYIMRNLVKDAHTNYDNEDTFMY